MAAQMIKKDQKLMRTCILYESVEGVSAFDAFKNFVKKMGDDVIDYQEFEFWYQRFSRGECDLDYDRSLELKSRGLLDLPKEFMEDVIKLLTPIERLIFRKTCKPIRNIISRMNPGFTRIHVSLDDSTSTLSVDDGPFVRREPPNHKIVYTSGGYLQGPYWKISKVQKIGCPSSKVVGEWPETLALRDFFVILANPGLVLEELSIDYSLDRARALDNHFKRLNHKIKAARVKIATNSFYGERDILPYLDSTVIREIELDMKDGRNGANWTARERKERMQRLVEMDAWKGAESKILHFHCNVSFPVELFLDCKRLTVYLEFETRSMNSVIQWMKALFSSPVLQQADIHTQFQLKPEKLFGLDVINQNDRRYFPIPGTNEVFELSIFEWNASGIRNSELSIRRQLN